MVMTKTCSRCGIEKPPTAFVKNSASPDGLYSQCKLCRKEYYQHNREKQSEQSKVRYAQNKESKKVYQREYSKRKKTEDPYWRTRVTHMNFAREYGYDFEELESWYEKQWMKQQAQCAICGQVFSDNEVIDHCHSTMELRGLLCTQCNVGIGMLQDSPELCTKASSYLIPKQ